jgi:hypothetical protein
MYNISLGQLITILVFGIIFWLVSVIQTSEYDTPALWIVLTFALPPALIFYALGWRNARPARQSNTTTPQPSSHATNAASIEENGKAKATIIKCGNCSYIGPGERARSSVAVVLAWVCVVIAPLITILYFLATPKYRCPNCRSTFLGVQKVDGTFAGQNGSNRSRAVTAILVLLVIGVVGILASVVLASLNAAREKAAQASTLANEQVAEEQSMRDIL